MVSSIMELNVSPAYHASFLRKGSVCQLKARHCLHSCSSSIRGNSLKSTLSRPYFQFANRNAVKTEAVSGGGSSAEPLSVENFEPSTSEPAGVTSPDPTVTEFQNPANKSRLSYKNKFLWLMGLRVRVKRYVERYLRSELLRRVAVTVFFVFVSRAGHFLPIPGFDRELLQASVSNVNRIGAVDDLEAAMVGKDMPMNLFTLGIGPILFSSALVSICMQLKVIPRWNRLREEGKSGMDVLKSDMWLISGGFALVAGFITAAMNRQYALSYGIGYMVKTSAWLTGGALLYHWISDCITESGFGQGPSVLISVGIFTSFSSSLSAMMNAITASSLKAGSEAMAAWVGCFLVMTLSAAVLLCAKTDVELHYFDVDFDDTPASELVEQDSEVRPYAPFSLAPQGVTPVFYAHYLCLLPKLLESFGFGLPVDLSPSGVGVGRILYYVLFASLVVVLNCTDTNDIPGQLSVYLVKIGARVKGLVNPDYKKGGWGQKSLSRGWAAIGHVLLRLMGLNSKELEDVKPDSKPPRPGEETQAYLTEVQGATRFVGGVLLALLSISSNAFDYILQTYFRGSAIGFTSMLIIVGSIISMRRTFEAYQQMPELEKVIARYKFSYAT